MKFRKKPVIIDAVKWTGSNIEEALTFIQDGCKDFSHLPITGSNIKAGVGYTPPAGTLTIPILEGDHTANPGDWIIRGVKGEFYPCKPDIFEMTYEPVIEGVSEIGKDYIVVEDHEIAEGLMGMVVPSLSKKTIIVVPGGIKFLSKQDLKDALKAKK